MIGADALPERLVTPLAVSLWDFSWYLRAGPDEPFEDIDRVMRQAVERGYTAVRVCAAPLLTSGVVHMPSLIGVSGLGLSGSGEPFGIRTRWCNVVGGYTIDVHDALFGLLVAAREHGMLVILSSWEYQQCCAFASTSDWWDAVQAIPQRDRFNALATAWDVLLAEVHAAGLGDVVAFAELHNEVDTARLPEWSDGGSDALRYLRARHPSTLVTASWAHHPPGLLSTGSRLSVGRSQIHGHGVLGALEQALDLHGAGPFPNEVLREMLRADAPTLDAWGTPERWRHAATVVHRRLLYVHDWVDVDRWDRWLAADYGMRRGALEHDMDLRLDELATWSAAAGRPFVVGEGWRGHTPMLASFEDGPLGLAFAERGVRTAMRLGAWGAVPSSNAAPHHALWADVGWQRRVNALVTGG